MRKAPLSLEERKEIERQLLSSRPIPSYRAIARSLGRHPSNVSHEVRRFIFPSKDACIYRAEPAHAAAEKRKISSRGPRQTLKEKENLISRIFASYTEGRTVRDIAIAFDMSPQAISRFIRSRGHDPATVPIKIAHIESRIIGIEENLKLIVEILRSKNGNN